MRFSAIGPVLLGLGALAMTLLCLFAGSATSFLPEFSLITVRRRCILSLSLETPVLVV
jgi:hypothetical protein